MCPVLLRLKKGKYVQEIHIMEVVDSRRDVEFFLQELIVVKSHW